MSQARHAKLADKIRVDMAAASFSLTFTPKRLYKPPTHDLTEQTSLTVSVVGKRETRRKVGRYVERTELQVDTAVQRGIVDPDDITEPDGLAFLVEEISDWLGDNFKEVTIAGVVYEHSNSDANPLWLPAHIQMNLFTNVTTHTFTHERELS